MDIRVDGERVYAYTGGRAFAAASPAIVFVHGAALDHSVWALQSRYFAHHGRNVLVLDLPGHGRSTGPAHQDVEALAAWLPRVLDAAGIDAVALVGHSLGALVALECAACAPLRVTKLALLGPAVPMRVSDALLDAAASDEPLARELVAGWSFSAAHRLGGSAQPGVWMPGSALRHMERATPGMLHRDLGACNAYAGGLAAAARVRCPVLVLRGADDLMAPLAGSVALIEALPHCVVRTIPGSGHSLMSEAPDAVLDALRAFL